MNAVAAGGGLVIGLALVAMTLGSMINTMVVPRSITSRIAYACWRGVRIGFLYGIKYLGRYETKDRVLSLLGPVSLLTLLGIWLLLLTAGFGLILWPMVGDDLGVAIRVSGSSILTLGVASAAGGAPTVVIYIAAATGLVTVALLIGYLPTIYGAYNRRETLVTMLESRAGEPAWGPEVLARQSFIGGLDTLPALYGDWERWAADLAESHVNYPWLMFFRSPQPLRSWITGLLAVMDSAALYLALAPSIAPSEGRSCLRMGFSALRAMAEVMRLPFNPDPQPSDPISLSYEEFAEAVERIRVAGFPMEREPAEAWIHFRGWRVNYEEVAYAIADMLVAVPALWSGPRKYLSEQPMAPKRPAQRTPEHPEGITRLEAGEMKMKARRG